jgi:hypothetical protein
VQGRKLRQRLGDEAAEEVGVGRAPLGEQSKRVSEEIVFRWRRRWRASPLRLPSLPTMVSQTVQVRRVCETLRPRKSLTIQNPESFR